MTCTHLFSDENSDVMRNSLSSHHKEIMGAVSCAVIGFDRCDLRSLVSLVSCLLPSLHIALSFPGSSLDFQH